VEGGRDKAEMFSDIFCVILTFCGSQKKEKTAALWKL